MYSSSNLRHQRRLASVIGFRGWSFALLPPRKAKAGSWGRLTRAHRRQSSTATGIFAAPVLQSTRFQCWMKGAVYLTTCAVCAPIQGRDVSHNTDDRSRSIRTGAETACAGKVRFTTFALATGVAARGRRRECRTRSAYACGFCGGFHLGNRNRALSQMLKRPRGANAGDE